MGNYLLVTASMTKKPNVNEENLPIKRKKATERMTLKIQVSTTP